METFSQTSNIPYDRHTYRLYLKSGKCVSFEYYIDLQEYWFTHNEIPDYLDIVEVLDKPKRKEKVKSSGFAN
jgi:hypothetical protein